MGKRPKQFTALTNFLSDKQFHPYFALGVVALSFLITAVLIFWTILQSINQTFEEKQITPVLPIRINFNAIDQIALRLKIEIPARNIPSRTYAKNTPPLIFNFTSIRSQVLPEEEVTIFLNAYDPEGDVLDVKWNASGGVLNPLGPYGPARWKAPKETGTYTLGVSLNDNQPERQPVSASIAITVIPRPEGDVAIADVPQIATRLVGLIKEEGASQFYFVKSEGPKGFRRLVVDNKIVDFYGHLSLNTVQIVSSDTLKDYTLVPWIRGKDKTKVYQVNSDKTKQWFNMLFEDFKTKGGSDEAVFTVNETELNFYSDGPEILP